VLGSIDDYLYAWRYHADGSVEVTFESISAPSFLEWEPGSDAETVWRAAVVPADLEAFDKEVLGAQREAKGGEHDYRIRTQSGRVRWLHERWRARELEDGSTLGEGIVTDITALKLAHAELDKARAIADRLARTDVLTGAANRREFRNRLAPLLARKHRVAPITLALLDIDHFKAVNDTYGHPAGDEVIVEVARRLAGMLGPDDLAARWGGEEFAVYLHGVGDAPTARARCEELRLAIANEPVRMMQGELQITISIGAAIAVADDSADELIDRADGALYQAKRSGRNRTRLVGEAVARDDLDAELPDYVHVARALALAAGVRVGTQDLHTEQVSDLAGRVAEALGASPIVVMRCRLAGLLHDIGKVAVPDSILTKRGPLTAEELEVMRSHAIVGAEIVCRVSALAGTAGAIRHHHERWDGGGYPDGLSGEAIPLEARIVTAADAYSAMTGDRLYSDACEFDSAIAELRGASGSQFDQRVVEALIRVLGDVQSAKRPYLTGADQAA
jgi:diguanylate cyclase (GGDEF)-like protein/putative nucleotidyltransferase with HDIG domain